MRIMAESPREDVENTVRNIGSRLELFTDDWLIAETRNVELRLHNPVPQEVPSSSTSLGRGTPQAT
ncbi:MAG: hypothetical protein FGF53_00905 [Candidatus Brockarchaeota archaeon]|nr:hypothetical protein [Candidatus Brockarchaeota archaeon]MBO3808481.1 hypothetical protein [Candidatus Brockarchaeota archaeon]